MLNKHRHFFLYAKGHYQKKELIEDLKQIVANYSMVETQYVTISGICSILLQAVKGFCTSPERFERFMQWQFDVQRKDIFGTEVYPADIAFIKTCMSIMFDATHAGVDYPGALEIVGELGDPDPSILPLSRESTPAKDTSHVP